MAASAMPQSEGDMSCLLHYLKARPIDGRFYHIGRHRIVEPQRGFADLHLERFDPGYRLKHAGQSVDAATARHAADDEGLFVGHTSTPVHGYYTPTPYMSTRARYHTTRASMGAMKIAATLAAGLLALFSTASVAQQARLNRELPRIGYLGLRPLTESAASMELITALREGLADLGYVEGTDYVMEVRIADNDPTRYPKLITELTQLQVRMIVSAPTPAAVAIHKANPAMPIVVRGPDIVGAGLARTAKRPGGVVTGIDEL